MKDEDVYIWAQKVEDILRYDSVTTASSNGSNWYLQSRDMQMLRNMAHHIARLQVKSGAEMVPP